MLGFDGQVVEQVVGRQGRWWARITFKLLNNSRRLDTQQRLDSQQRLVSQQNTKLQHVGHNAQTAYKHTATLDNHVRK